MTLLEIFDRVKSEFGDTSGAEITDTELMRWANDGQLEIVRRTGCLQDSETYDAVASQQSYDLTAGTIDIDSVYIDGTLLRKRTKAELDQFDRYRNADWPASTPSDWYIWGRKFYLWPSPSSAGTANIEVLRVKAPTVLTATTDTPEIPAIYHEDLVQFVVIKAKEKDEEYVQASALRSELQTSLAWTSSNAEWPHTDSYPAVRALPGDLGDCF